MNREIIKRDRTYRFADHFGEYVTTFSAARSFRATTSGLHRHVAAARSPPHRRQHGSSRTCAARSSCRHPRSQAALRRQLAGEITPATAPSSRGRRPSTSRGGPAAMKPPADPDGGRSAAGHAGLYGLLAERYLAGRPSKRLFEAPASPRRRDVYRLPAAEDCMPGRNGHMARVLGY
jgi:hypothetical protein